MHTRAVLLNRPPIDADESAILGFAKDWVRLAAREGFEVALRSLDSNEQVPWTQALLDELTFDHFDDGTSPRISDPSQVEGLRVDVYPFDDGSGFGVEHDLAMDGKRSDFTALFEFQKQDGRYRITLTDIHVL